MMRMAGVTLIAMAIPACLLLVVGMYFVLKEGWDETAWRMIRIAGALVVGTPLTQFVLGLSYFKLRDALLGAPWARKSFSRAILFDALIALVILMAGVSFFAAVDWSISSAVAWALPMSLVGIVIAAANLLKARLAGPTEIMDAVWACLDVDNLPNRGVPS
jgi:ATP-dependent Clp protease ATP-binding subunit ClpC